ncbi:MAG: hypothetical protein IRZ03_18940 [Acidobacterium ailaaui]|nr:hypothetical protein [Pseudacidobacterium ailaaui]
MEKIIFRLEDNNIRAYKSYFKYNIEKPYTDQRMELYKSGYIFDSEPSNEHAKLHTYYATIENKLIEKTKMININIPFNSANRYDLYIDYLYYRKVLNNYNFVLSINKKYLIDLWKMGISRPDIILNTKNKDLNKNEYTHKSIYVKCSLFYKNNK